MVSPSRLVKVVSQTTGIALPTVTDIDRRLVQAGLRSKGGRGLSAARMTPVDAAHLLTAILASSQSNLAAEAVVRYAATTVDRAASSASLFGAVRIDDLSRLTPTHSFVQGLAALIASASHGDLAALLSAMPGGACPRIEIFAFTRATRGRIRISGVPDGTTASLDYQPLLARPLHPPASEVFGDLEQSRRITERTICAVAALLAGESPHV